MRVLVTGGAGFLGSHVVDALAHRGHVPIVMDVLHPDEAWRLGHAEPPEYVWKDMRDVTSNDFIGVDAVIHCAASTDVPYSSRSPRASLSVSLDGTIALYEAVRGLAGCARPRVVTMSSHSVYGKQTVLPTPESVTPHPSTLYGALKLAQEHVAYAYEKSYGIEFIAFRSATLYGPRGRVTLPAQRFLRAAFKGESIRLTGGGVQQRDQNWIGDAADALVSLAVGPLKTGVFNCGSGEAPTIRTLAERCRDIAMAQGGVGCEIIVEPERFGEEGVLWCDNTRIAEAIGYAPTIDLEEGLRRTAIWMASSGRI